MADNSKIEWTEATWNIITGCSVISPGCTNCYAMKLAGTRLRNHPSRQGLTIPSKSGPVWNGEVRFNKDWLTQPLHWKRPRMIFVCAHGDLFHESVPDEWLDEIFAVMCLAPQHTFQILTKRAKRMREYMISLESRPDDIGMTAARHVNFEDIPEYDEWPPKHLQLGVSAEDQERADERILHLAETPAAMRWVSVEPLLGEIDLTKLALQPEGQYRNGLTGECHGFYTDYKNLNSIDWVVVGGESGPHARPMQPDWVRSLRDQCKAARVPFLFKQWGRYNNIGLPVGKKKAGRELDGVTHTEFPSC